VNSCSRISAQALLQSVQEMVQSLSELHDLRRRVREAEASFTKAKRLRHDGLLPDDVEKHYHGEKAALVICAQHHRAAARDAAVLLARA
jgi:hypothetical protein